MIRVDTTVLVFGENCIFRIPTGAKLLFNGTLKQLKSFCNDYGNDSDLWDNPNEKTNQIVKKAESFRLIRYIPINNQGENK